MSLPLSERSRVFALEIENDYLADVQAFPVSFTTKEDVSHNQEYVLTFESLSPDVDLDSLLGQVVRIKIRYISEVLPFAASASVAASSTRDFDIFRHRHYYAYVTAGYDDGENGEKHIYKLELSTWLWFLMQNRNSRIFQEKSAPDVVTDIFSRYSQIAEFSLELDGDYPQREYCAQFGETDFTFVSRLLEEEGIWYYFRHEQNKHVMVITDRQTFQIMPDGYADVAYHPIIHNIRAVQEGIQELKRTRKVRPNEIVLRDYDYLHPGNNLQAAVDEPGGGLDNVQLEWYDYAAGYQDARRGEHIARLRLEMMQSDRQLLRGKSSSMGLIAGYAFSLSGHPDSARNRSYKLLGVHYRYLQGSSDSSNRALASGEISCTLTTLNDDVAWRPLLKTRPPRVSGLQSATVVGTPNSEVYTDQHARIRVHFHWDRYKSTEADSSCWVRVVQAWAGKGWGVVAMPRVGQEVLITYVDGNLDRPMVTGIVYNGENPPPYNLPQQIGHTGIVSRSLQHGLPQNASQITLVDNRGGEKVLIHAERDMQTSVEQDQYNLIDRNRWEWVQVIHGNLYNTHIYYTNINFSVTGLGVHMTGVQAEAKGFHAGVTMVDVLFTGAKTSFTALDTSFTTVGTRFAGVENNFTGLKISATGIDNLMLGVRNKAVVMENELAGNKNSFVAFNNKFIGMDNSAVVNRNTLIGVANRIVGVSTELCGINTVRAGNALNFNASEINVTEARVDECGNLVSTSKSRIENNGTVVNSTDYENRTVGLLLIN
ncbi:type VI secretion system Vgr family protein [Winslowiella iniecta]|uniref:type VI secretion system Vgr family protein n=1 Tax=Winslowiella iniecta TaxID=1560201 RepID=UPI00069E4002|nr:type VI secretion system tip protein VgrG [Winslowiella iniecta]